ncbi:MAG: N-acetylmuramoyl-L-alanine amidase [Thalassobaculaceae bacterium]|nr:N-acetylmuramoyl-L-alanine amidase [Thalassobaculaceae bacterium]
MIDLPSPNQGERRGPIDMLLLHYTDMPRVEDAVALLCDPTAQVSAHYVVGEDGRVWRLVDEERRAWHAGVSWWAGESDINSRAIGIEISNPGHSHGYRPFPEPQMRAVSALCRDILSRHRIPAHRVLGHSDVAPGRKIDPGHLFDWRGLAGAGIGLWPESLVPADLSEADAVAALGRIGYLTGDASFRDPVTRMALDGFRRHWEPLALGQPFDRRGAAMLQQVAEMCVAPQKPFA